MLDFVLSVDFFFFIYLQNQVISADSFSFSLLAVSKFFIRLSNFRFQNVRIRSLLLISLIFFCIFMAQVKCQRWLLSWPDRPDLASDAFLTACYDEYVQTAQATFTQIMANLGLDDDEEEAEEEDDDEDEDEEEDDDDVDDDEDDGEEADGEEEVVSSEAQQGSGETQPASEAKP